ncbi:asparagine synthase-related protein [Paraglaciecola aquimarina]|uniref:asparagine synthase (glutamine-hydrolyzing) n=1 Tax=Paraglaciecola algarum TaxID=3050085 RepID=A0ABS9DDR8_9ALTE|nr:asparagine synthase C-terminal domain-containing protein [Paraglaciecola sp. G1-23]MCF2949899.1 asparagine synthase-related protein [Paraglaciecola sp. G1-23]
MFIYISRECSQKCNIYDTNEDTRKTLDFVSQCALKHYAKLDSLVVAQTQQVILFSNCHLDKLQAAISEPVNISPLAELKKSSKNILLGEYSNQTVTPSKSGAGKICTDVALVAHKVGADFDEFAGDCFAKFEQHFYLYGWHSASQSLHVAKSPLNPTPIYWAELPHGLVISYDISLIRDILATPITVSQAGLASWLSGFPNPAVSLFNKIQVLPIGYRVEIDLSLQVNLIKFWDIDPENKVRCNSQDDYAACFFETLSASVQNAMQTENNQLVSQMSGGMDSTSITALANKHAKNINKQVLPLSHIYSQSTDCDEQQLVDDMLGFLKIENSIKMTVDKGQDRDFLSLYPTDIQSPGTVLSPRYVRELALVKQAGANVLLSGNGGDEMCWGHSLAYTQRFKQGDLSVVPEVLKACPKLGMPRLRTSINLFVKPLLPDVLFTLLGRASQLKQSFATPDWLTDKGKELAETASAIDNPFNLDQDPVGYNRYISLKTTSTYNALHSYDKLSRNQRIRVRHPFFDTKVAELSFALPVKQLIQGAYPKWLLRYSMQNELPKSVCWNVKKTTFDQHFGNLVRENASEIRDILQDERLADMGLVNPSILLAEFDTVVASPERPVHVDLLYAILTYSWLQAHFPE